MCAPKPYLNINIFFLSPIFKSVFSMQYLFIFFFFFCVYKRESKNIPLLIILICEVSLYLCARSITHKCLCLLAGTYWWRKRENVSVQAALVYHQVERDKEICRKIRKCFLKIVNYQVRKDNWNRHQIHMGNINVCFIYLFIYFLMA